MKKTRIGIIGGGAAGLMAAATLIQAQADCEIFIFDKNNHLGAKVIISGGGRCNITTGVRNPQKLLKNYTRGAEFLKAALSKFNPEQVYNWFEENGVPLKMQDDQRAFPVSDDGKDVVGVFERMFAQSDCNVMLNADVQSVTKESEVFYINVQQEGTDRTYECDYVVLATGGNAYKHTGSSGDGYTFAKSLGHTITQLGPSLSSFMAKEKWPKALSGLALPNAKLKWGKIETSGPFLFTHFGISGPVTFALSSQMAFETIDEKHPAQILIIPNANKTYEQWDEMLIKLFQQNHKKAIKNILGMGFPSRLVHLLLQKAHIHENKTGGEISKTERKELAKLLGFGLEVTLIQRRPGDEFVTAGGVDTAEINKQTMESLICENLYFGGEVMNVDGVTGGFNLQSSWATGRLAGKAITKKLLK